MSPSGQGQNLPGHRPRHPRARRAVPRTRRTDLRLLRYRRQEGHREDVAGFAGGTDEASTADLRGGEAVRTGHDCSASVLGRGVLRVLRAGTGELVREREGGGTPHGRRGRSGTAAAAGEGCRTDQPADRRGDGPVRGNEQGHTAVPGARDTVRRGSGARQSVYDRQPQRSHADARQCQRGKVGHGSLLPLLPAEHGVVFKRPREQLQYGPQDDRVCFNLRDHRPDSHV
mmetsp:Transcript_8132/g.19058  ORF Transcript_8132/g.19058 Transcript_8132/m.19058 type:complete len:229 (-) Transcript_8132:351-1037(-)